MPRQPYNAHAPSGGEASISKGFRILEHTADAGLEAYGKDLPELFANAARGLFQIITELGSVRESVEREVRAEASDPEALLVAWLNEFVFLFDTERLLFRRFDVLEFTGTSIRARAYGEPADRARHDLKTGVKSATYHGLAIRRTKRGYSARIIVDI